MAVSSLRAAADLASAAVNLMAADRGAEGEQFLRRALALQPGHPDSTVALARLELSRNHLTSALRLYREAAQAAPFDLSLQALRREVGLALYARHYWEEAAQLLRDAAAAEPWDHRLKAAAARASVPPYLAAEIDDPSLGRTLKRYAPREGTKYMFIIDVVGTCNLRCPTCPVGNSGHEERAVGFMPVELFAQILDKIARESPVPDPSIVLFNWGEPLLHPQLPRILDLIRQKGFRSYLSTNLNIKRGLEDVIAAGPDDLKISISGFSAGTYARTHARGNLDLVKANMLRLYELREAHKVSTHIWVGHHIYRSTQHEAEELRETCARLGFGYHAIPAFYMPLERVVDVIDHGDPSAGVDIIDDLPVHPAERAAHAARTRSGRYDCELRFNQTVINHDGSVGLCCCVYDRTSMLGVNFLDEPLPQIEGRKYRHPFCKTCFAKNLNYAPAELMVSAPTGQEVRL